MKKTALILTTLLLGACGGGISGLEAERRVSTLTEYEAAGLCESVNDYISTAMDSESWVKYACTQGALNTHISDGCDDLSSCRSACEDMSYECQGSRDNYGKTFRDFSDCGEVDDYDIEDCRATVAEVEACAGELREASLGWSEEVSCNVDREWRPSRRLSAGCASMLDDYDCNALFFGD